MCAAHLLPQNAVVTLCNVFTATFIFHLYLHWDESIMLMYFTCFSLWWGLLDATSHTCKKQKKCLLIFCLKCRTDAMLLFWKCFKSWWNKATLWTQTAPPILLSVGVNAPCVCGAVTYLRPAGAGSGRCFWWSEADTYGGRMAAAVGQTAGRSAGISTGPPAGWSMEGEPHRQSGSDLK